ncbi:branched-chain amino acid ABC transporter permease [Azospirillum agricola]|uniref:branched-chain amino acid ABC transporter permease n=1 Tax=Azospirillum agricola TaxID=1720247 RepID=UPI000A0F3937|nr:branched-chain amino acid ABC transporter permease [Azospirillum agricola]SMH62793.1 amino acid/amide ABC transporter membrane protein 2, HAAT family [Azospirillum lipoferum]
MTGSMTTANRLLMAGALLLALLFPLAAPNDYYLYVMSLAYIVAISATGLNLILGYTGQLNLAHAGFMAVGAYTVGILTVDFGVPYWVAFVLSGVVTAAVAVTLGLVSLRLKTHYFVIFTLCVGFILYLVIEKFDGLTHGTVGVIGIPAPTPLPTPFGPIRFDTPLSQYYLVLVFLALALWVMNRIVRSLLGRAFMAVRNSEDLAEALGVDLMRTKLLSFVLSTVYAGFAGGLYAGFVRFLGPGMALESHTFEQVAFILVGGLGTLYGPLLGAVAMTWLTQSLQFLQDFRMIVFGPMLILLVMYLPQGVIGLVNERRAKRAAAEKAKQTTAVNPTEVRANA